MKLNLNNEYGYEPYDHWTIENFLDIEDARKVSSEFIDYDSDTLIPVSYTHLTLPTICSV